HAGPGARAGAAGGSGVRRSAGRRRGGGERRVAPGARRGRLCPPRGGRLPLVAARELRRARPRPGRGAAPGADAGDAPRVRAARAALPGATDFHLWGLDLAGGGWCACPRCGGLSPADQALNVSNAVADALGTGGRVFHLAYHDTLEAPRAVRPDPRAWAELAPRERCYAHALDDAACTTNAAYRRALE